MTPFFAVLLAALPHQPSFADPKDPDAQMRTLAVEAHQDAMDLPERIVLPSQRGPVEIVIKDPARAAPGTVQGRTPAPASRDWVFVAIGTAVLVALWLLMPRPKTVPVKTSDEKSPAGAAPEGFSIVRVLGEGGMGVVYEALDRALDRKVAIKKMRAFAAGSQELDQFLREAKVVASLQHPNIVAIHQVVHQGEEIFLVFEHIQGDTLEALMLRRRKPFALPDVQRLLRPVCDALAYAHSRKVVHRDLKPSNVMIAWDGMVKVMDFGIARRLKELAAPEPPGGLAQMTNSRTGTLLYMAPEAYDGVIRPEVDVYALGVILYQLLGGRLPFTEMPSPQEKLKRGYAKLSTLARLPAEVDALVDEALEPEPTLRLRSPAEFWARLAALRA